jgi:hypothetical protein
MVFCLPHMYIKAAARMKTKTPAMAIPTMAPVERPEEEEAVTAGEVLAGGEDEVVTGVGVEVAPVAVVVRVMATSGGKYSPGLKDSVVLRA